MYKPNYVSVLVSLVLVFNFVSTAIGGIVFQDDFEDGVINTAIYTVIGNAVLTETNGQMQIRTFGIGDGVSISVPSIAKCITMSQSSRQNEFDVGEGWQLTGFFDDSPGSDVEGFHIELQRPFWNKCTIDIQVEPSRPFG